MKTLQLRLCLFLGTALCLWASHQTQAQSARSLYFMDNAPARLNLNPALQPMRGFFNFPVLG